MSNKILDIDKDLQAYRSGLGDLLVQLAQLAIKTENPKLIKTIDGLKYNIDKPFMFIVVGEVKAGKSSFVNALLETEVCATDVKPCTDRIQAIYYSETPQTNEINSYLAEIGKPLDILKEIAIVDTPGTNSIIENHQMITEEYIPNSDLVFFVLFAKNPYFASTWEFLDYVSSEWLRKVVFILQQADLLKASDLSENIAEVKKLAENKGIRNPTVFAASAELELEGHAETSGFNAIRDYIKNLVTTREAYKLKLRNVTSTVRIIINELGKDIDILQQRLDADKEAVRFLQRRFERGREQSASEVEITVNRIADRYSRIATAIKEEFRRELSFLSVVKGTFTLSLKRRLEGFSDRCTAELKSEIEEISQERAAHILDGIRQFGEDLKQDLDRIPAHQIEQSQFHIKVLERRQETLENIKRKIEVFFDGEGLIHSLDAGVEGAALGAGGAFAAMSVIVAQVIELVVANFALAAFEIAFAGIGVLLFAVGFAWRRHSLVRKFEQALDAGKSKLESDVDQRLNERLSLIYDDLERECSQLYDDVAQEEQEIVPLLETYAEIQANAAGLFAKTPTVPT
ncbi:MAG: dynamin family protein [Cyanobacteria bacterium P01_F01_bin.86]